MGTPKQTVEGVVQHSLPVKLFHEVPAIGEALMTWLEELFLTKTLTPPHIKVAEGGLAGINAALDRLRSGELGAKRIVIPINDTQSGSSSNTPQRTPSLAPAQDPKLAPMLDDLVDGATEETYYPELAYADALNSNPDRLKFAYWVPNVSGVSVPPTAFQRLR